MIWFMSVRRMTFLFRLMLLRPWHQQFWFTLSPLNNGWLNYLRLFRSLNCTREPKPSTIHSPSNACHMVIIRQSKLLFLFSIKAIPMLRFTFSIGHFAAGMCVISNQHFERSINLLLFTLTDIQLKRINPLLLAHRWLHRWQCHGRFTPNARRSLLQLQCCHVL